MSTVFPKYYVDGTFCFYEVGVVRAEDEIDLDEEMIVSEDQVMIETDGDDSNVEEIEPTDADTYLLFTKPVFEEKASIGTYFNIYPLRHINNVPMVSLEIFPLICLVDGYTALHNL